MRSHSQGPADASALSKSAWERVRFQAAELLERWAPTGLSSSVVLAIVCFFGARELGVEAVWPTLLVVGALAAALMRLSAHLLWRRTWERSPDSWRLSFRISVLAGAVAWGGVCAFGIASAGMTHPMMATLMCLVGMAAGTVNTMAPDGKVSRSYVVVVLVPPVLASLYEGSAAALVFAAVGGIGVPFLLTMAARAHREYWRSSIGHFLYAEGERRRGLLATAIDQGADAIAITDHLGRIEYANPAFEHIVHGRGDEILERRPMDLIPVERGPEPGELAGALARGEGWSGEVVLRDPRDQRIHLDVAISPVRDDGGGVTHYVWVGRDMTEVRRLEARLGLADRMSTVGTLAAGVAHEINNPASFIALNIDQLRAGRTEHGDQDEVLQEIEDGTRRIQETVRQLLVFARGEDDHQQVVDLCSVLDAAATLAGHEIRYRAQLVRNYAEGPLPVVGDEGQLVQLFVNLLINAAQALDERPGLAETIEVTARREADGTAVAEVRDTGPGIPTEHLERVFEPFFTTKPVGSGTGLGLANCHAIASACGGDICARNGEERGAVFEVRLVGAREEALAGAGGQEPAVEQQPTGVRARPRPMRLLVVDDEAALGRALRRALSEHQVEVVSSGAEGIAEWETGEYDAMLCDLMMPDVTGMDVYRVVEAAEGGRPERIVFMTGGAFTREAREFLEEVDNTCLSKPIDTKELRRVLDTFRDGRAHAGTGSG